MLHHRAAPRDDHEGQQVHSAKLCTQLGVGLQRRLHAPIGEAHQAGHLLLRFDGLLPGEEFMSTYQQHRDGDLVRRELEVPIRWRYPARRHSFCNRLVQETQMNLCYAAKGDDMLECFRLAVGGFDVAAANYDGRTPMVR
ncbi:unnamed protein product [Closterium sp. NIES-54]